MDSFQTLHPKKQSNHDLLELLTRYVLNRPSQTCTLPSALSYAKRTLGPSAARLVRPSHKHQNPFRLVRQEPWKSSTGDFFKVQLCWIWSQDKYTIYYTSYTWKWHEMVHWSLLVASTPPCQIVQSEKHRLRLLNL